MSYEPQPPETDPQAAISKALIALLELLARETAIALLQQPANDDE